MAIGSGRRLMKRIVVHAVVAGTASAARSRLLRTQDRQFLSVGGEDQLQGQSCGTCSTLAVLVKTSMPSLDRVDTGGDQASGALDLHHADTAGADLVDILQIAQGGDLDARQSGPLPES